MKHRGWAAFFAAGVACCLALVVFVAPHASSEPDGLNRVAIDQGFASTEETHALASAPTAGYEVRGVDRALSGTALSGTALAGVIGVAITFVVGAAVAAVSRKGGPRTVTATRPPPTARGVA